MRHHLASIFLRIGLSFVFLYAAFVSFLSPNDWIGFFPAILSNMVPARILVTAFSIFQALLGVSLLFRHKVTTSAVIAFLTFVLIAAVNWTHPQVAFMHVGLAFSALSLAFVGKIRV